MKSDEKPRTQSERFIEAARELGADTDEAAFNTVLKKVAAAEPANAKPVVRSGDEATRTAVDMSHDAIARSLNVLRDPRNQR